MTKLSRPAASQHGGNLTYTQKVPYMTAPKEFRHDRTNDSRR